MEVDLIKHPLCLPYDAVIIHKTLFYPSQPGDEAVRVSSRR